MSDTTVTSSGIPTIEDRIVLTGGRTSGFDYLRIVLAASVLLWHSVAIVYSRDLTDAILTDSWIGHFIRMVLPMFFALSGFLVTASYYRSPKIKVFLIFRALRIFPALAVEVFLAAVILGAVFTTLPLSDYYADTKFWTYFLNIPGLVQYTLPGVFADLPIPEVVNGSLWTIPYELECYLLLTVLMLFGILKRKSLAILAFLALSVVVIQLEVSSARGLVVWLKEAIVGTPDVDGNFQEAGGADGIQLSRILVLSFLAGALMQVLREHIPFHWSLALASGVLTYWLMQADVYFYAPLPAAYLTIWLGLQTPPRAPYIFTGDYSYGLYLYAFPIQQSLVHLGLFTENVVLHMIASLLLTSAFAIFSWHVIEKRALSLKSIFLGKR